MPAHSLHELSKPAYTCTIVLIYAIFLAGIDEIVVYKSP